MNARGLIVGRDGLNTGQRWHLVGGEGVCCDVCPGHAKTSIGSRISIGINTPALARAKYVGLYAFVCCTVFIDVSPKNHYQT